MDKSAPSTVLTKEDEHQGILQATWNNQPEHVTGKLFLLPEASVGTPQGFHAGGLHCGLKRKRLDLGWIYSVVPSVTAGVFTTNLYQAAPLVVSKESLAVEHKLQGILVNSANANACTGERGMQDAYTMRSSFARKLNIPDHYAAVVSTGVIGEFLPMGKVQDGIARIQPVPQEEGRHFEQAILTTDTCIKHVGAQLEVDGHTVTIGGTAKGSGMIEPNMATMLGFVTTDAAVEAPALQQALKDITNDTFNMITVDGDTSTNDMVLVMANGQAGNVPLNPQHPDWDAFYHGLALVCEIMAKQIARDGEGATRLIEVFVKGAPDAAAAKAVSKAIIGSNLVKTAIYGQDPNWGRIVCAIGYSGARLNPEQVSVSLGNVQVVHNGLPVPFDEEEARGSLRHEVVKIAVDLHQGQGEAVAWGCDLTYEYVRINASYRT